MFIRNQKGMELIEMLLLTMAIGGLAIFVASRLYFATSGGANSVTNGLSPTRLPVFGK